MHRWAHLLKQQFSISVNRFANQGKQIVIFRFHLQQTTGSLPFLFSVCSIKWKLPFPLFYSPYIYLENGTI
jgi:hypothetical protein